MNINKVQTISELIAKSSSIYSLGDDRLYEYEDFFYFQKKYLLRTVNSTDVKDFSKNLIITMSWFIALSERFHFNIEKILLKRYSYKCPRCLNIPCNCSMAMEKTQKTGRPSSRKPNSLDQWQEMIAKIYCNDKSNEILKRLENELDHLHFICRMFRKELGKTHFKNLEIAACDYFVSMIRVFNSKDINLCQNYNIMFADGCFACHASPCQCNYYE